MTRPCMGGLPHHIAAVSSDVTEGEGGQVGKRAGLWLPQSKQHEEKGHEYNGSMNSLVLTLSHKSQPFVISICHKRRICHCSRRACAVVSC